MLAPTEGPAGLALKEGILFGAFFILCLIHGLALKGAFLALGRLLPPAETGAWVFWVLLPPMFAATLVSSTALFLLVERPLSLAPRRPATTGTAPGRDARPAV
jgi:hypothetical protein